MLNSYICLYSTKIREDNNMPRISDIEILQQIEHPVLFIRSKIRVEDIPKVIGESFAKLGAYLHELDELLTDVPYVSFPGYENIDENNMEIVIGFPVGRQLAAKDDIQSDVIPARKIIFCMYKGDYGKMTEVYNDMGEWIKSNGYESSGTCYEYYYNGPDYPAEEMLTKVVISLKEKNI